MILLVILVGLGIAAWFSQRSDEDPAQSGSSSVTARVDHVIDGDTARFLIDGKSESVRYIGIDTPEMDPDGSGPECFAHEALDRNRQLLARSGQARLVFDRKRRDHYGRLLAYVYAGPDLVQAKLLEGGFATSLEVPPNTKRAAYFADLESEARRDGRGLWGACPDAG